MVDFQQLPFEVLCHILQLTAVTQRLSSCALVCTSWAKAAVAATDSIDMSRWPHTADTAPKYLRRWVYHHGSRLTTLRFSAGAETVGWLNCPALLHLEVHGGFLKFHCRGSGIGLADSSPRLTRLVLRCCHMRTKRDELDALSVLTALQDLTLSNIWPAGVDGMHALPSNPKAWAPIPGYLFLQLVQLTRLVLENGMRKETFWHFSCLTALQHLELHSFWNDTEEGLGQLSQLTQLTWLTLYECHCDITLDSTLRIASLTNLKGLVLDFQEVLDPLVLRRLTKVQHLSIRDTHMLAAAAGAAALLAVLPRLQQLTYLAVSESPMDYAHPPPAAAGAAAQAGPEAAAGADTAAAAAALPAAYSALTSSSKLQHLELELNVLPLGAWQHAFAAGKQLSHLTHFSWAGPGGKSTDYAELPRMTHATAEDMCHMVSCCPGLRSLSILDAIGEPHAVVAPLVQLPALTALELEVQRDTEHCSRVVITCKVSGGHSWSSAARTMWSSAHALCNCGGALSASCCVLS